MKQLRAVSKTEKIIFPIMVTTIVALILPDAAPLIGCLMLGNLMKECGVVDRLSKTAQNELMNIVVIFLGLSVGATATGASFLNLQTLMILAMGIIAFGLGSGGGVLLAKLMNLFSKEKINPLDGCTRKPAGWSGREPRKLPAHACHGAERCRCDRFCCSSRYPAYNARISCSKHQLVTTITNQEAVRRVQPLDLCMQDILPAMLTFH